MEFPVESFDAIFCMDALHYFAEQVVFPKKMGSLLKPNGLFSAGGPCYRDEINSNTPKEFLHDEGRT